MGLPVHFLALVDVRALVGKGRLDCRVRERMDHLAPPENLRRRLFADAANLFCVLPAHLAVHNILQTRRYRCGASAGPPRSSPARAAPGRRATPSTAPVAPRTGRGAPR